MPRPLLARAHLGTAGPWCLLALMVLGGLGLCVWALQAPGPRDAPARADQFSEPRARAIVDHLSGDIGIRLNGTPGHRRAAAYLAAELRRIPGLEVELQEPAGTHTFTTVPFPPFVYRTINVVARLPGRSPKAVLLNAHFDTQLDSTGAADDAAGVAALVESLRILAREGPLAQTLIVNLNGAEEIGLLGAAGFLKHRWAKEVRAYVYVEALPGGMTGLFGAGPGNPWLARTYARAVPRPFGTSVAHDLVQAKLLPHNGDHTPFHEAGLAGLDMAMTGDGWAYHTMLDRTGRLLPGSLQHLGDSVLAVTRALASADLPADDRSAGAVWYDVLGLAMVTYSAQTARGLALFAVAFAVAVIAWAARRRMLTWLGVARALGWTVLAALAAPVAAMLGAALVSLGLGRPLGWFSAPGLVVLAFGLPAAAGGTALHALWHRRARGADPRTQVACALAAGVLFWCIPLVLASLKSVGAGYLALFWVAGGALALVVWLRVPRLTLPAALACLLPAVLLTLELAVLFLSYFIPITGMLAPGPIDVMIAALVGVTVAAIATLPLVLLHSTGGFKRAAWTLAALGVVGLALTAGRFPYTPARAKRVAITHLTDGDQAAIRIRCNDRVAMGAVIAALPPPATGAWRAPAASPLAHERPAHPPAMPTPRAEVEAEEQLPTGGERRVTLRIHGTSPLIRLRIPAEALRGWSLAPSLTTTPPIDGKYVVQLYDLEPAGHAVILTLRGQAPVEIELRATDGARASGPEVEALLTALPPWVTATATSTRTIRLKI